MWQIVLPNLIQSVRSKKKIGGGVFAATVLATFVLRKIYTKWKIHKNMKKIQKKRDGLRERKSNLKQRFSTGYHKLFKFHISNFSLIVDGILLTPTRKEILSKEIKELQSDLKSGLLKPLEVLQAYQAKALEVDQDINAVCDFILEATDWAKALEDVPEEERGALYGLPISVKVN